MPARVELVLCVALEGWSVFALYLRLAERRKLPDRSATSPQIIPKWTEFVYPKPIASASHPDRHSTSENRGEIDACPHSQRFIAETPILEVLQLNPVDSRTSPMQYGIFLPILHSVAV